HGIGIRGILTAVAQPTNRNQSAIRLLAVVPPTGRRGQTMPIHVYSAVLQSVRVSLVPVGYSQAVVEHQIGVILVNRRSQVDGEVVSVDVLCAEVQEYCVV